VLFLSLVAQKLPATIHQAEIPPAALQNVVSPRRIYARFLADLLRISTSRLTEDSILRRYRCPGLFLERS